jgi:hypothetical protein
MNRPKQLLSNKNMNWELSAMSYWIENDSMGDSVYLNWFGTGWVIQIQESFLTKEGLFKHKADIVAFKHSHISTLVDSSNDWEHIFSTKEEVLEIYIKNFKKK